MKILPLVHSGLTFALDSTRVQLGLRPLKPLVIGFTINTVCNLRCSYCFIGTDKQHFPEGFSHQGLTLEQVKTILENIRKDADCLIITGGEPFLYPQFEEVLRFAKNELQFLNISIATNAIFIKKKKHILQYIDRLGISYDLTRAREYPKQLLQMREDLVLLKKEGVLPPVHFTMTLLPDEDLTPIPEFLEFCREHTFRIWAQPVREDGDFVKWPWFLETLSLLKKGLGEELLLNNIDEVKSYSKENADEICFPETRLHVHHDGTLLYPCHKLEHLYKAGSVLEKTPMTLWREAEKKFGSFPTPACGNCGFTCYFETSGHYRHPLTFLKKAYHHVLKGS